MPRTRLILLSLSWGCAVIALLAYVGLRPWDRPATAGVLPDTSAGEPARREPLFDAPAFALTDQTGRAFSSHDLLGRVYAASFFFTNCQGACPIITGRMAQLQRAVSDADVRLVSFTVDPVNDTPAVLAAYADAAGAQAGRWHFLTGPVEAIHDLARRFNVPLSDPTNHTQRILLIDAAGVVRGHYSTASDAEMTELAEDARVLAEESR